MFYLTKFLSREIGVLQHSGEYQENGELSRARESAAQRRDGKHAG